MKSSSLNRFSVTTLALFTAAVALHPSVSEARPGIRGAAPTSIGRAGGGHGGQFAGRGGGAHAGQFANHGGGQFQARANTGQHANTSARTNQGQRFSGDGQVNGGNRAVANNSGNRTINNNGSRAVNNGNINVASGNNINVNDGGWGYWNDYHPVATGVAVGTAAAVTTAAIGSMMYSLPPACSPRPYGGMTYYYCGGAWYAPQYRGDQVVYVVVNQPG